MDAFNNLFVGPDEGNSPDNSGEGTDLKQILDNFSIQITDAFKQLEDRIKELEAENEEFNVLTATVQALEDKKKSKSQEVSKKEGKETEEEETEEEGTEEEGTDEEGIEKVKKSKKQKKSEKEEFKEEELKEEEPKEGEPEEEEPEEEEPEEEGKTQTKSKKENSIGGNVTGGYIYNKKKKNSLNYKKTIKLTGRGKTVKKRKIRKKRT